MSVKLNPRSYEHARKLIQNRHCVLDEAADWSDHRPSRHAEKTVLEDRGIAEFARWHLGEDDEIEEHAKSRYKFPLGDFTRVHRCAVLEAESHAGQDQYTDIQTAAAHLHSMLDELIEVTSKQPLRSLQRPS